MNIRNLGILVLSVAVCIYIIFAITAKNAETPKPTQECTNSCKI